MDKKNCLIQLKIFRNSSNLYPRAPVVRLVILLLKNRGKSPSLYNEGLFLDDRVVDDDVDDDDDDGYDGDDDHAPGEC